jgi:hypothetical protein
MYPFLIWLESTDLSTWVRESPSLFAFPAILSCHTIGMGLVAGTNAAIALRILGVARAVPMGEMKRFLPVMWAGFWLNAVSGIVLLIGYPTKALTNPVFYLKLTLIAIAMGFVQLISRRVFLPSIPESGARLPGRVRLFAAASLLSWASAITAGRLLAYTYRHILAGH